LLFPLLWGEGKGEGKGDELIPIAGIDPVARLFLTPALSPGEKENRTPPR